MTAAGEVRVGGNAVVELDRSTGRGVNEREAGDISGWSR
jgi:hypothetical protein